MAKKITKKAKVTSKPNSKASKMAAPKPVAHKPTHAVRPLHDRVLIMEDSESSERKTDSGIIIPVTVTEDKAGRRGKVVAVGSGHYEDGVHIPISVEVGDVVLFQWGDKIKHKDSEYYLVKESEIMAIVVE